MNDRSVQKSLFEDDASRKFEIIPATDSNLYSFAWPENGADVARDFISLLKDKDTTSRNSLIPWMQAQGLGDLWTPVFKSLSLRKAEYNPDNPRVLAFKKVSEVAILGVGFGPCPGMKEENSAETLEFFSYDTSRRSYEFREADFSKEERVSEANPKKCLGCHGQDPRPIIEPYNLWPGWVGSMSRNGYDFFYANSWEAKVAKQVYAAIQKNPTYSFLNWKNEIPIVPEDPKNLTSTDYLSGVKHSLSNHPNSEITFAIAHGNVERVARMIMEAINKDPVHRIKYLDEYLNPPYWKPRRASGLRHFYLSNPKTVEELRARLKKLKLSKSPYVVKMHQYLVRQLAQYEKVAKQVKEMNFVQQEDGNDFESFYGASLPTFLDTGELLLLCEELGLPMKELSNSLKQPDNFTVPFGAFGPRVRRILSNYSGLMHGTNP